MLLKVTEQSYQTHAANEDAHRKIQGAPGEYDKLLTGQ